MTEVQSCSVHVAIRNMLESSSNLVPKKTATVRCEKDPFAFHSFRNFGGLRNFSLFDGSQSETKINGKYHEGIFD